MFFILSKILFFLLNPVFWMLLLVIWSFRTRNQERKKILRWITLALLVVFTNPFLFSITLRSWQTPPATFHDKKYSAAILLGGITRGSNQHQVFFADDADRFIQATRLYHTGVVQYIVVTGGSPSLIGRVKTPEAIEMKQALLQQGIPEQHIIVEQMSRNTFENASYSKTILDSLQIAPPYVLVTSAMHMPRATKVFAKAGMQVIPCPAAFKETGGDKTPDDYLFPSIEPLYRWPALIKEMVGTIVYRISGRA